MKVYTIGRGEDCDVILDDESGMISRRHAILKAKGFNRYEIVDVSKNGTNVDAIRIQPNIPTKVTRNSVIVFAGVKQLDWKEIPDSMKTIRLIAIALITLIAILGGLLAYNHLTDSASSIEPEQNERNQKEDNASQNVTPKATEYDGSEETNVGEELMNDLKNKNKKKENNKSPEPKNKSDKEQSSNSETEDETTQPDATDESKTDEPHKGFIM